MMSIEVGQYYKIVRSNPIAIFVILEAMPDQNSGNSYSVRFIDRSFTAGEFSVTVLERTINVWCQIMSNEEVTWHLISESK